MTDCDIIDKAAVKLSTTSLHGRFLTMDQCCTAVQALADAGLLSDTPSREERMLDAFAKVTPCTCSAQRERAEKAEAERDAALAKIDQMQTKLHEAGDWHIYESHDVGEVFPVDTVDDWVEEIRAILDREDS